MELHGDKFWLGELVWYNVRARKAMNDRFRKNKGWFFILLSCLYTPYNLPPPFFFPSLHLLFPLFSFFSFFPFYFCIKNHPTYLNPKSKPSTLSPNHLINQFHHITITIPIPIPSEANLSHKLNQSKTLPPSQSTVWSCPTRPPLLLTLTRKPNTFKFSSVQFVHLISRNSHFS